jgi:hypothetical protein
MTRTAIAFLFCLAALCGCASYRPVDADKAVPVGDGVFIQPQIQWANAVAPNIDGTVWTVDGLGLNELRFMTGVLPGRPLLEIGGVKNADLVHYQADMLPDDISELTVSTLQKMGYSQAHTANLKPAPFGPAQGFSFDFAASRNGLEMKGLALGAQRGGKLDLIVYLAPAEYYFDRYRVTVEKIFSSVTLQPK